jgi:anaerobic selenocysteine-containing dehydrogenase
MKIGRRCFLSFIVGGAAGTALSPLPYKLTDDLSIWTQMWPWTPVPEDGKVSYVHSSCSLCPGGCGISVRKVENRAVKIEGMKGHPVNDGGICILGLSGLQLLYGPARVKTPLKRVAEGKWKKISWDEAFAEIGKKLTDLRAEGKSHTVGCIAGSDRGTVSQLLFRFLKAYGSPNFITLPTMEDTYALALKKMQGTDSAVAFDIENADFILSFGAGLLDGWGSPVRMFKANSAKKGKVVQIEPRLSNSAAKADQWIPVKPGTEAVLALGLAHVIIKEALYKKDFIASYTEGFEGFKTAVEAYPPAAVAEITGADPADIEALAKAFAGASAPLALCGRGQGKTAGSLDEFTAVHSLNALVGNINNKGGVLALPKPAYIQWPEVQPDEIAAKGLQTPRIDAAGTEKYPQTVSLPNRLAEAMSSATETPLQVLFVSSDANPCYTLSDVAAVKKAFAKIPLKVSFSSYMDETAAMADFILPGHVYLERYEDVPAGAGLCKPVIGLSRPVLSPLFDTRHPGDLILGIAKAVGGKTAEAFPWENYEACLQQTFGDKWETLKKEGVIVSEAAAPGPDAAFATNSKKFEFMTQACKLPAIEGDEKTYSLVLIPFDSIRLANGAVGNPPFLTKTLGDDVLKKQETVVEISPKSAQNSGLKEGCYAMLTTPKATVRVRVHLSEGIMPGVIAVARGLGHTAFDNYLAGKGVNFNELVGPVEDPGSGLDAVWGIRANLSRVSI